MNDIEKERLEILEEAARRQRKSDYTQFGFADEDKLTELLRKKFQLRKKRKSEYILQLIKDDKEMETAKEKNKIIHAHNERINNQLKPIERMIKVLEIELILFNDVFQISEISNDIHKEVFPDEETGNE